MSEFAQAVECPNCGGKVVLYQDKDHSEYAPSGRCGKCKRVILMTYDGLIALESDV